MKFNALSCFISHIWFRVFCYDVCHPATWWRAVVHITLDSCFLSTVMHIYYHWLIFTSATRACRASVTLIRYIYLTRRCGKVFAGFILCKTGQDIFILANALIYVHNMWEISEFYWCFIFIFIIMWNHIQFKKYQLFDNIWKIYYDSELQQANCFIWLLIIIRADLFTRRLLPLRNSGLNHIVLFLRFNLLSKKSPWFIYMIEWEESLYKCRFSMPVKIWIHLLLHHRRRSTNILTWL